MKVAMLSPSRESEKAISGYSSYLVNSLNNNNANVKYIPYDAGSLKSFFKVLNKIEKCDAVHIQHEYNLFGYYGLPFFFIHPFLKLIKKKKIVTTMHTVLSQKEKFKDNPLKTVLRKILYFTQNRVINWTSDKIIVHADFFRDILEKEYNIKKEKIVVLPQGVIDNIKITPKSKAKKELNLSGKVYLIIGNLVPDHGADIILKEANKIGKTILVVANPNAVNDRKQKRLADYINYCMRHVKEKGFSKYVRFDIKPISDVRPRWWLYFSAADLVLQPYKGGVGSGIFTHAMATRTPVIASNISFFREISKKYGCIKISKTEEDYPKVIKEAMKKENYQKMVSECGKYSKENSWSNVSKKYIKIYSTLN